MLPSPIPGLVPPHATRKPRAILGGLILLQALLDAGCAETSYGQPAPPAPPPPLPSDEVKAAFLDPAGNPLMELQAAREQSEGDRVGARANWVLGLQSAELGNYLSAAVDFAPLTVGGFTTLPIMGECDNVALPDAVESICAELVGGQTDDAEDVPPRFVFIEDRPNLPAMRVLGRNLLRCARDAGFTHFAVQALEEDSAAVTERGYLTPASGLALREPQFARLVQDSLTLGFELVDFRAADRPVRPDSPEQDVVDFAEVESARLLERTIAADPGARVLVWTEPLQARKREWRTSETGAWRRSLADHVFAATTEEPYSLDQLTVSAGTPLGAPPTSGTFLNSPPQNSRCAYSFYPESRTGLAVLSGVAMHPAAAANERRWDWLNTAADEQVSLALQGDAPSVLVQAFPAQTEVSDRIPSDQAICSTASPCELALAPGSYQFRLWTPDGQSPTEVGPIDVSAASVVTLSP